MSGLDHPPDAEADEANSRLAEGLKACRSIVSDYRAMIAGEQSSEREGGSPTDER